MLLSLLRVNHCSNYISQVWLYYLVINILSTATLPAIDYVALLMRMYNLMESETVVTIIKTQTILIN